MGRGASLPQSLDGQQVVVVDSGDRAVKVGVLTWGDLASRLKGRRPKRSEKSAEAVVAG
jgi:hypothetical protein